MVGVGTARERFNYQMMPDGNKCQPLAAMVSMVREILGAALRNPLLVQRIQAT
jgi:hypothetical protein